jgi:hypothetical protein
MHLLLAWLSITEGSLESHAMNIFWSKNLIFNRFDSKTLEKHIIYFDKPIYDLK